MELYYSKKDSKHRKLSLTTQASASSDLGEQANDSKKYRLNEEIDLSFLPIDPKEKLRILSK